MLCNPTNRELEEKLSSLEKELNRYKAVFDNTGAGIIISETDMTISLANEEFSRMTGYNRSEIEGRMKWVDVVALLKDREKMTRYHNDRRTPGSFAPRDYEFILKDRHNQHKNILARVEMIPGTTKSLGSFIDITPRVQAQEKIRDRESRLRGIVEAFDGFIYVCTLDMHVVYMNPNLASYIGSEKTQKPCYKAIFNLDSPCLFCPLERVLAGKTVKQEIQWPDTGRWYYAVNTPIFRPDNQVTRQQTVLLDIHERKQSEMDIKARQALLDRENAKLRTALGKGPGFSGIVGKSPPMLEVYELILRAATTHVNVIIYGESGTGKELVAKAIHDMSDRSAKRFVPVNCGAIPPNLMESEFFGVKKGAFTGAHQDQSGLLELANGGSLFLDELGEMELNFQVKLLRVLEGGGYMPVGGRETKIPDIRIIAATNQNLNRMVKAGTMREDFFYRIHILPIYLPPLRERKEDIPLLVTHFLEKHHAEIRGLPSHVMAALESHDWPGNVRELENTLQRYLNLDNLQILNYGERTLAVSPQLPILPQRDGIPLKETMNYLEKEYITRVLEQQNWNRSATARTLSIGRKTLYVKIRQLGIKRPD